jgi:hypothetical protein
MADTSVNGGPGSLKIYETKFQARKAQQSLSHISVFPFGGEWPRWIDDDPNVSVCDFCCNKVGLGSTSDGHLDGGFLEPFDIPLEENQRCYDIHAVSFYDKWCLSLKDSHKWISSWT